MTIWRDVAEMREWMRGGIHGEVMWRQPHWLECYWGMRWRPGGSTGGDWEGDEWHCSQTATLGASLTPSPDTMPAMAWMRAALGHTVPVERRQVEGVACATYRLRVAPWRLPEAVADLRRLRGTATSDPDSFTISLGLGTGASLYLLVIATAEGALDRLQTAPEHQRFLERWGDRAWWSTWEAESEFGHWQRHRLREGQLAEAPLLVDVALPARLSAPQRARHALATQLRYGLNYHDGPREAQVEQLLGPMLHTATERQFDLASLDRTSIEVLEGLVSELVGNRVRDAGLKPTDCIRLQVRGEGDWLRAEMIDRGRRFDPHVPLVRPSAEESRSGLFAIDQIAQRWGIVDRAGNRHLWFEVCLPVPQPPQ